MYIIRSIGVLTDKFFHQFFRFHTNSTVPINSVMQATMFNS